MSNRWRRGLQNKVYDKKNQLEQKEELSYRDLLAKEELEEIEEELNDLPVMDEDTFEEIETRIEEIKVTE